MKNMAKADRPKSAVAMLPVRPIRESGNPAHVAFKPETRESISFIPEGNHAEMAL